MTFTVAVERRSPDEQFEPKDIKLLHQECGGGEIIRSDGAKKYWGLRCKRCHTYVYVEVSKGGTASLMRTVVDGESRKIKSYYESKVEIIATSQTKASVLETLASTATSKDTEPVRATIKKHAGSKDDTGGG